MGTGPLAGIAFGGTSRINPRIVISDTSATPLARYRADEAVSAAARRVNGQLQVLVADDGWTAELAHGLLKACGVPLVSDVPAVIESDREKLFVYATSGGSITLTAPPGRTFDGGGTTLTVKMEKNENRLLPLAAQSGLR